jgi:hypothetical protein
MTKTIQYPNQVHYNPKTSPEYQNINIPFAFFQL